MPFTVAHPLLILPLRRYRLPLSALVIGSTIPDFEYFIGWTNVRGFAHTIPGIFIFCLPFGLIVFILYHLFLKYPLLALLPSKQQRKLYGPARSLNVHSFWSVAAVVIAVFFGIATHFLWDSFTHQTGFMVRQFLFLQTTVFETQWVQIKFYKLLQHASTIIGITLLWFIYIRWSRKAVEKDIPVFMRLASKTKEWVFSVMLLGAILAGSIYGAIESQSMHGYEKIRMFVGMSVISGISVLLVLFLIYGIVATLEFRSKRKNKLV